MSKVIAANDATFDATVRTASGPVLVKFEADWCGPCKAMKPMLEEIAAEQEGKVKVVSVNVDESAATARAFNVRSLPTLLLFKNGQPSAQKVGAARKAEVLAMLQ